MSDDKVTTNDGTFKISQGIKDVMKGIEFNDPSRISIYGGRDSGVHTGTSSPTTGRHGGGFGSSGNSGGNTNHF